MLASRQFFWAVLCAVILLGGCTRDFDTKARQNVIIRYAHVANVQELRFSMPVRVTSGSINQVTARPGAYWAIFVVCSIDVSGSGIQSFNYNVGNFVAEYGNKSYPFKLDPFGIIPSPAPIDIPAIEGGIASVAQVGPYQQAFSPGLHASLNYRIAILVPGRTGDPPNNTELRLRYENHPTLMQARDGNLTNLYFIGGHQDAPRSCPYP